MMICLSSRGEPYQGHAEDAAWRDEATKRINQHRKSDLIVLVVDAGGNPVEGVTVFVEQQSHAFHFGTAVNSRLLLGDNPEAKIYRERIVELFNTTTIENGLKWHRWESGEEAGYSQTQTLAVIDWLRSNDIKVRGHVLVWPSEKYLPKDILAKANNWFHSEKDQQYVRNRIEKHIASIAAATAGKIYAWDVVNEPRKNHVLMDYLPEGNRAMVDWFRFAKQAAPDSKLFLNEYGILDGGEYGTPNQHILANHLQRLLDAKAPIDGVGLQAHFLGRKTITPPEILWRILDRYAAIVSEVQITEFDFDTDDEQLQADYLQDFITAMFAHSGVTGITQWGFWEGAHWRPQAALYRKDWSIKPCGRAFLDLVYDRWWSKEELRTDESGEATARVFQGNYTIVTNFSNLRNESEVTVSKEAAEITIRLQKD